MDERWSLIEIHPRMLISFLYPSKAQALVAAIELCDDAIDQKAFYIEGPHGQRIDRAAIKMMHAASF